MKKSKIFRILCVLLATVMSLSVSACQKGTEKKGTSSTSAAVSTKKFLGETAAFGKFKNPVTVHVAQEVDPTDKTLVSGDTPSNNYFTRLLKNKYNINVIVDWSAANGDNYNQKVSLAIASGKMPDGMVVWNRLYFTQAANANLLGDITDEFKEYASTQVQQMMASTQGKAMENATYNGKMVALPNISVVADGISVMWIQKNWLDQLKMPVPKTLDEIEKTAKAFVDNKMAGANTIGIAGPSKSMRLNGTFQGSTNNGGTFEPVFCAMDAYPGFWLNENGKAVYGTTTDNTKKTLQLLAKWYKEGIIDPQMGTRDQVTDPLKANQCGIFFGPWWQCGYGNVDSFTNNPKVDWEAYPVYTDDEKWNVRMPAVSAGYTLVGKNASSDAKKAIVVMNNVLVRDENVFNDTSKGGTTESGATWFPLRNVMSAQDECEHSYKEILKVLKGQAQPSDYSDPKNVYKLLYQDAKQAKSIISPPYDNITAKNFKHTTSNDTEFQRLYSLMIGDRPFATVPVSKKVSSITYGQTKTMTTKWANLQKLEDEATMKIVLGKAPIDSFDEFVKNWNSQGGTEITAEVQQLIKK